MARVSSKDPLDKFRFTVSILGFERLGFMSVESPAYEIRTKEYAEGGDHLHPKQIVDSITYKQITLLRGVVVNGQRDFEAWASGPFDRLLASKTDSINKNYRRDITITHRDRAGREVRKYNIYNVIPVAYEPASDFASDADNGVSIEKLSLRYESFTITEIRPSNSKVNLVDLTDNLIAHF